MLLSTASGWKRSPARSDPFTGKSALVMKASRIQARRKIGTKAAKRIRQSLINVANQMLNKNSEITDVFMKGMEEMPRTFPMSTPSPFTRANTDSPMPAIEDDAMIVDEDNANSQMVFATRTKPVKTNKYQKRLGAKKAKKLELAANSEFTLSPQDATTYRALAARCNYLAQDRPDISYASKELCREFSVPNLSSFKKLKRLVRYLAGMPRLVYRYPWQVMPTHLIVSVDTDFAGCQSTRRSTSGGAAMIGQCLVKHWSKTQTTISLSSGEAELHGIAMGCAQALGIQSLLRDLDWVI